MIVELNEKEYKIAKKVLDEVHNAGYAEEAISNVTDVKQRLEKPKRKGIKQLFSEHGIKLVPNKTVRAKTNKNITFYFKLTEYSLDLKYETSDDYWDNPVWSGRELNYFFGPEGAEGADGVLIPMPLQPDDRKTLVNMLNDFF